MEADPSAEPFAMHLLEEYQQGKSVEALSRETGIPVERIKMRLRAATAYLKRVSAGRREAETRTGKRERSSRSRFWMS